jgi:hypothetical protein
MKLTEFSPFFNPIMIDNLSKIEFEHRARQGPFTEVQSQNTNFAARTIIGCLRRNDGSHIKNISND